MEVISGGENCKYKALKSKLKKFKSPFMFIKNIMLLKISRMSDRNMCMLCEDQGAEGVKRAKISKSSFN